VAPVSSLQYYWLCRLCLQCLSSFMALVSPAVVRVSSTTICCLWLHWLSLAAPVAPVLSVVIHSSSSICISCRLSRHLVVAAPPVAVVCGSSLVQYLSSRLVTRPVDGCRLWLWSYLLSSWLRYLSSILSCGRTPGSICRSLVAPVAPACRGSSICCGCLQYHYLLLVAPVAPVSVTCGSCCSCGFNRQPSSVLVIFL